ncbi:hypothetical protein F4779DRAFT_563394 [Xylariaceae sp. FL0662B]|nr:hypothetical protein F4779DRAFT_563394 [Xylariaceae sp. FL0662B]
MSSPTEPLSKLSLGSMPPTTRLQSRRQKHEEEDTSSDSESSDSGFDIDDSSAITLPSKTKYSLDYLDERTRQNVTRTVAKAIETPSKFILLRCQSRDQQFIFEIAESVEYTIRTGTENTDYDIPNCSCESAERGESPCRHILWLFDQISSQVLASQRSPLILTQHGYSAELGNPYYRISSFHLDVLADSLCCDAVGQSGDPNPRRVQETRQILASLNEVPIDEYRPDLFNNPRKGRRVIKKGDLEQTVFRMLLRNDEFFHYFLSSMRADELINNRFRGLQHRADAVLQGLEQYASDRSQQTITTPKDVEWCSMHLTLITQQIRSAIQNTDHSLEAWELRAAARALIHVLGEVAKWNRDVGPAELPKTQRNLYYRLIGDQDRNFVIEVLDMITPRVLSPWAPELGDMEDKISRHGVPLSYLERLRSLITRIRSSGAGASTSTGSKRTGQGQDRGAKRRK